MKNTYFETLKEQYRESLKVRQYSNETITRYIYCVNDFYEFLKQHTHVQHPHEITQDILLEYQKYNYYRPKKRHPNQTMDPTTQYKMLTTIGMFLKFLVKRGVLDKNPMEHIELPRQTKSLPKSILSKKEIVELINAPNTSTLLGIRDRAMLELVYSTGIRLNEIRNLSIYDVDMNTGMLKIRNGKGNKDRIIPFGTIAGNYVAHYIQDIRPLLVNDKSGALLFINRRGKQMSKGGINTILQGYVKKAGIRKKITPHTLRHTCATHMLSGRADIRHIQEMLGHKSIESTQIYTRVLPTDLKKVHQRCHPREKEAKAVMYKLNGHSYNSPKTYT